MLPQRAAQHQGRRMPAGRRPAGIYLGAGLVLAGLGTTAAVLPASAQSQLAAHSLAGSAPAAAGRPAAIRAAGAWPAIVQSAALRPSARPGRRPGAARELALRVPAQAVTQHRRSGGPHRTDAYRGPMGWGQIARFVARSTYPAPAGGTSASAARLTPLSLAGPQAYLPITPDRMANAVTIVRTDLALHLGLRSAVIAIATALQESTLLNLPYGDRDSLGLFQQRPSAGWGAPAQILNPHYAASAFLLALRTHQQADPSWASQPLWANAQAVQVSGFPYAYAKWESQAAGIVAASVSHLV